MFIYFWPCRVFTVACGLFSSCGEQGSSLAAVHQLLTAVASLLGKHMGFRKCNFLAAACMGFSSGVQGLSCSIACGIFPDQGSNPCHLHWQADSQPLDDQGSPLLMLTYYIACVLSCFSCVQLFVTLWTIACQSSVHGILQARILEWVASPSSVGST